MTSKHGELFFPHNRSFKCWMCWIDFALPRLLVVAVVWLGLEVSLYRHPIHYFLCEAAHWLLYSIMAETRCVVTSIHAEINFLNNCLFKFWIAVKTYYSMDASVPRMCGGASARDHFDLDGGRGGVSGSDQFDLAGGSLVLARSKL